MTNKCLGRSTALGGCARQYYVQLVAKSLEGVVAEIWKLRQAASELQSVRLHLHETDRYLIAQALILPVVTMSLQKCRYILLAITTGQFAAVSKS